MVKGADFLYTDVWVSMGKEAEAAERIKTLRQAFRIIQPVDAQHKGAVAQALMQAGGIRSQLGALGELGEFFRVDADGCEDHMDLTALIGEAVARIWLDAECCDDIIEKGGDVTRGLEADDVASGEGREQIGRMGQDLQQRGRHERDVQEKSDAVFHAERAQLGGHGHQLVVVNPDQVIGLDQRQ